jgi:rod shape determining protein RodA
MTIKKLNYKILIPILLLAIISIITIYSAKSYTSNSLGNLALKQSIWYLVGILLVVLVIKLNNEYFYRHSYILYIIGNILLFGLFFLGTSINNSKCWYVIPGIGSFQPSEFMKIFLMLMLASMIHNFRSDYKHPTTKDEFIFILKTLLVVLIPSILTFMEPDTGSVIIYLVIYFCMMFISGIKLRWFIIALIVIIGLSAIILSLYFFKEKLFLKLFGSGLYYRLDRIFKWQAQTGLQLQNSMAAIGSAGLFGHGFNNTPIYFPEASTDFIFAVYASNFGLVGVLLLLGIIVYLDINIILLAQRKITDTDKYILIGILAMLLFQQIQNIGMTIGILPITGITLPFISYGGSSLLSYMLMVGILLNISMEEKVHYKYK